MAQWSPDVTGGIVFQDPRVDCGRQDFEDVLDEFEFLFYPDPDVDSSILVFYVTEYVKGEGVQGYFTSLATQGRFSPTPSLIKKIALVQ